MSENQGENAIEFDEIWFFVEEKLRSPVPSYIKNVLKVCGFNNAITIASIDNDDIKYFENEVRNGNVTNYFEGNEELNILEGSSKSVENFEFTLGHKKFLMTIKDFLKTYLEKNGQDSVISKTVQKRKHVNPKIQVRVRADAMVPRKRMKNSVPESSIDVSSPNDHYEASSTASSENVMRDDLRRERSILLGKAIKCLISKTPEMYVKIRVQEFEMKRNKVSANLVTLEVNRPSSGNLIGEVNEAIQYVGSIACPYCSKVIHVSHSSKKLPNGNVSTAWWNTSNFNSHLSLHQSYVNREDEEHTEDPEDIDIFRGMNIALNKHNTPPDGKGSAQVHCSMLQNFVSSAERNSQRSKPGYRYDIITKMFAAFIKMIAGLLAYETLQANFPLSLPSVSTVNRFTADNGPQIIEGEMRTGELKEYLESRNLPMRISLSEDGTRITAKISYDPNTNQLIGFALPLDANGMPVKLSFPARNAREIQNHFTNTSNIISTTAYVQIAQPIKPGTSPFCFMIYSTDNKFTANDVFKRWKFQAEELEVNGITINNISTDGDARCLMAMKVLSRIGQYDRAYLDCEWFSCGGYVDTTFIQDGVHIITKGRSRVLLSSRIFPIGDKIISASHLKYLIEHVSKDKHLLTRSDIQPEDRQNFESAEKVCSERTIQCLLEYVPGSEGTAMYLKVMRSVLDAFLDNKIESEDRIYLIWYAVFFCRGWRSWLLNSDKSKISAKNKPKSYYNLKDNFISSNCYTCIELNAHALVKQVLAEESNDGNSDLREESSNDESELPNKKVSADESKFIFPNLFGSQPCESMFRQVRSFTSTFCTVVNFNMLDIIHRIRKIQLLNDIINISNGEIKFPRYDQKAANISEGQGSHQLKSINRRTIIALIEKAREAVSCDLEKFGIDTSKLNFHCQIQPAYEEDLEKHTLTMDCDIDSDSEETELQSDHPEADFIDIEEEEELQEDINYISGITGELNLPNYDAKNMESDVERNLDEKGPFVKVSDISGTGRVVRKSALVYVLAKDKHKLSSDRLQRVKEKEYSQNSSTNKSIPSEDNFVVNNEIEIGDWCVFSQINEEEEERDGERFPVLLGLVLDFTYLKGKTFKDREYSKVLAPVQSNPEKEIGVLCNLYDFYDNGVLKSVAGDKHDFFKIDSYLGTIKAPNYERKILRISSNLVTELHKLIGL